MEVPALTWTSGSALAKTGPAGIFIDFSIIGLTVFCVMAALGEMLSFAPMARMYYHEKLALLAAACRRLTFR